MDDAQPFSKYRKWLIGRERHFVQQAQLQQQEQRNKMAASDKLNQSVKHSSRESFGDNSMKLSKHRHSMGSFDNAGHHGHSEEQPYQFNAQEDDLGYRNGKDWQAD